MKSSFQKTIYVITRETKFGEFTDSSLNRPSTSPHANADYTGATANNFDYTAHFFTDVDLRPPGQDQTKDLDPSSTSSNSSEDKIDQVIFVGCDTIVPKATDNGNDNKCFIENKNPR